MRRSKRSLFVRVSLPVVSLAAFALVTGFGGSSHTAQTFTIDIDGKNPAANEAFLSYFPNTVTVHPGDSVVFDMAGNGEPHTATFGTLANAAVKAFSSLSPSQQQNPPKSVIAIDAKVPQLLPNGPGDAIQVAANPCVIANGIPSSKGPCPAKAIPDFDGTQAYYNSGWLDSNQKFTVKISSSTAPGTYRFLCLLHREGMSGKVVVVPSSKAIPTPAAQFAVGQKQLKTVESQLASAVALERKGKLPVPGVKLPGPNAVLAGSGSPTANFGEITEFGPKVVKIPVGGKVTWFIIGPHSITFNSDKTNGDIRSVAADGSIHVNAKALAPANAPGEPQPSKNAPTSGIHFKVVASTKWDGQGFLNTGVFGNSFGPPLIEGYSITFTKAGTYNYICTVHDDMKGTIVVGGG